MPAVVDTTLARRLWSRALGARFNPPSISTPGHGVVLIVTGGLTASRDEVIAVAVSSGRRLWRLQ